MRPRTIALAALLLVAGTAAQAAQTGTVTADSADVHQFGNATSPTIGQLAKGTRVKMSSSLLRDVHGEYWYKVRMPTGEYGFVRASQVKPGQLDQELRSSGMSPVQDVEKEGQSLPPIFELRAMGVLGYEFNSKSLEPTGEGEVNISLFPFAHGYLHRMLAAGIAFQALEKDPAILGSLIYRVYTESRAEPEVRLRVGTGTTSGSLLGGLNFGMQYPLLLGTHFDISFYTEAGALVGFSSGAPVHGFLSAGFGFHL